MIQYNQDPSININSESSNFDDLDNRGGALYRVNGYLKNLIVVVEVVVLIMIVAIFDILVMNDMIYPSILTIGFKVLLVLMYKRIPVFFCKKCEFSKNTFGRCTVYIIIGVLVYSIVFQTLTAGLAVWGYNETIPGIIIDGKNLSTAFMRKWVYEPSWEAMNGPCVVYMTLPEDASTGVFVNFLVNLKSWSKEKWDISVEYLQITDQIIENWNDPTIAWSSKKPTKSTYHVPDYEYHKKNVYSAYINGLSSNSTLVFKIIDKSLKCVLIPVSRFMI